MCFSPAASFIASGGLAAIGVSSYSIAPKNQKLIASIPFIFAIQQAVEGFQWLSLDSNISPTFSYAFLFFALLFWPVYIPWIVFHLDKKRHHLMEWLLGIGITLSLFLVTILL